MADHDHDAGLDQLLRRGRRLLGVAGVVDRDQRQPVAEHPALGIDRRQRQLDGDPVPAAGRAVGSAQRVGETDAGLDGARRVRQEPGCEKDQEVKSTSHDVRPLCRRCGGAQLNAIPPLQP